MNAQPSFGVRSMRTPLVLLGLLLLVVAAGTWSPIARAAESSAEPAAMASPVPSVAPADAMCESASDLVLIIGFLRATSISEDGVVPTVVGAIAGLHEAQQLLGLVDDTYRPFVEDLAASLQGLRTTIDELGDQATLGAGIATIGESITAIGESMDALSVALRTPCPTLEDAEAA
jgi:hypothetical protein